MDIPKTFHVKLNSNYNKENSTPLIIDDAFKNNVTNSIQSILNTTFISGNKTKIQTAHSRLNFACPYCGDSGKNDRAKRGNLFWDTLYYHCYRAACRIHKPLNILLNDFGVTDIKSIDKISIINYIKEHTTHTTVKTLEFELFEKLIKYSIPKNKFFEMTDSKPIYKNGPGYNVLKDRLLTNHLDEFGYSNGRLYILNLTPDRKNVISYQVRKLFDNRNKYLTYPFDKMRTLAGLNNSEITEDVIELDNLNKLSTIFNILNIDFTKTVTSFEGPIDAKFMRNSIGQASVGRDTTLFTDIPTVRYFYDNDKAGLSASREKLREGRTVFLWQKFVTKFNLEKYVQDEKLKDLNDIVKICYRDKLDAYKYLNDFFSNDSMDLFYI